MTEIARLAQVSQPTVSCVLNGSTTVSPEIRERVLAFAQAHDYQFNALAKGLQGSKTNLLGVILKDISNGFFADLAKAIEARAKERGYSIILFNSDHNPQQQRENMDMVRRYRVDGMLITPTLRTPALWRECVNKLEIPTVVIIQQVEGVDSVDLDHEEAARQVAHHLAEKDYQRFLFIGKPIDIKYKGFSQELESMVLCPAREVGCFELEYDPAFQRALQSYLDPGFRTGIFAYNDLWALRTLWALRELNVSVPEQAGVIGFDDIFMNCYLRPGLSSVSLPIAQMANAAVDRLLYRIDHSQESELLNLLFRATLMPREST